MAENVLGSLFQDIADAIRSKTGGTDKMAPNDFPDEIASIEAQTDDIDDILDEINGEVVGEAKEVASGTHNACVWTLFDDGALVITGTGWISHNPWIPDYANDITKLVVCDGVTGIADRMCLNCSNLVEVSFPSKFEFIGAQAFENCTQLTSVIIRKGVTLIGTNAFNGSGLTSATFEDTEGWTAGTTALASVDLANPATAAIYLKTTYCDYQWNKGA